MGILNFKKIMNIKIMNFPKITAQMSIFKILALETVIFGQNLWVFLKDSVEIPALRS